MFSLAVLFTMMMVMMLNHQEKPPMRLISAQKYYSYLYEDEMEMQVPLYVNDINHPINYIDSYESIQLTNEDQSKRLDMSLSKIVLGYEETYLNEIYNQIILFMEIPDLNQDFQIEDLYLEINLVNDDAYFISLGSLSLVYINATSSALDWSALDGSKPSGSFISRLGQISIEYQTLTDQIDRIEIGFEAEVEFEVLSNQIDLSIPFENCLLDDIPVIIYYESGSVQTIANFKYMFDYQILKESGLLITTYALN